MGRGHGLRTVAGEDSKGGWALGFGALIHKERPFFGELNFGQAGLPAVAREARVASQPKLAKRAKAGAGGRTRTADPALMRRVL